MTVDAGQGKTYGDAEPTLTATVEGTVGNDTLNYTLSREEGENAGTYAITVTLGDNPNYDVTVTNGNFAIGPKTIQITADDKTKIYGENDPALTATTVGLVGSDYIVTSQSREPGRNIGTYAITVNAEPNQNYTIETFPGTLTIEARPVTVTAADKAKVYGTADPELTAAITGLAAGDSRSLIAYTLDRAQGDDVGTYAITASGETVQGNYTVTYVPATLTIVPEDGVVVTITAKNGSFKYDGTEKDLSGYDVAISNPIYTVNDFTFTGSSELKATNAGTYRTAMKAEDFTNTNTNFENVLFVVENGELEITKRDVTLTSASAQKVYDGTPLTNDTVETTGDGFAAGEGVNINMTGRITREGTTENSFTYTMANGTLAENYNITAVFGTLTVTEAPDQLHRLTIRYMNDEGETLRTFTRDYAQGETYSVTTERMRGYEADLQNVNGTMGDRDIEVIVTYYPINYTLTVIFASITDGAQVTAPITMELKSGDSYTVFVPTVEGYTALLSEVTGVMPASNRELTVFMAPEGMELADGRELTVIDLEAYGTPLGVADSILGGGEIIE